ncbi:MAG: hypothetical protein QME12_09205 [Nanoarchaeota archaeon]|nr:hypothetical protein [Nanoarchaeota archaeon]
MEDYDRMIKDAEDAVSYQERKSCLQGGIDTIKALRNCCYVVAGAAGIGEAILLAHELSKDGNIAFGVEDMLACVAVGYFGAGKLCSWGIRKIKARIAEMEKDSLEAKLG